MYDEDKSLIMTINGLVRIQDIDETIIIDLKYATNDNFTKKIIYSFNTCLLQRETAEKLRNANKALNKMGYGIKVFDGYRPLFAQKIFWDIVKDERFVANPFKGGSIHNRGAAVDVTLVDMFGNELEMPTQFDDFTDKSLRRNNVDNCNLNILTQAMQDSGFIGIPTEWWHFNDKDYDKYRVVDVDPGIFQADKLRKCLNSV